MNFHLDVYFDIAMHSVLDSRWNGTFPPLTYSRIYLPLKGRAVYKIGERVFYLRPGNLYLIPAGNIMQAECPRSCELYWTHFRANVFDFINLFNIFPFMFQRKSTEDDKKLMRKLFEGRGRSGPKIDFEREGILTLLSSSFLEDENPKPELIRFLPVLKYIKENTDRKISVAFLAKKYSMSYAYFSSAFRKAVGIPPSEYALKCKLEEAARMFCRGENLDRIADALGFYDAFHLSRAFKKYFGCSPRNYRVELSSGRRP